MFKKNLNYYGFGASAQKAALLRTAVNQFLAEFYIYCPIFFCVWNMCAYCLEILGTWISWRPKSLSTPVIGYLYCPSYGIFASHDVSGVGS